MGRRRGDAGPHRPDRRGGCPCRELRRGRHHRGAVRGRLLQRLQGLRRVRVLLPRDEHPRAGRALRHRDDHRRRHRQGGHPGGRRRAAVLLPGGHRAAGPRDRVPHQRRGRLQELRPRPGRHRPLPRAHRPRCTGGLGRRRRRRGLADVRPHGRQADRLGRRPRAGHQTHAAGAGRIRDRETEDADPLPQGADGLRPVGPGGDLQGPARRQGLAEAARLPGARGSGRGRG